MAKLKISEKKETNVNPRDIFQSLEGKWTLNRTISNFGKIDGFAMFTRDPFKKNCLNYKEEGIFTDKEEKTNNIFKSYDYYLNDGQICVFFTEIPQKLFHTLSFLKTSPISATATHLCNCDTYDAIYTFTEPNSFTLHYKIKGPKKDYSIQSNFKRVGSS